MNRIMSQLARLALYGALSFPFTGCYTTTIHSGRPPVEPGIEYDQKWHHGLVWGIAELSGPYSLSRVCPRGWAVVKTETSFLNGLVSAVTSGLYSPQIITVQCSATSEPNAVPSLGPVSPGPTMPAPAGSPISTY